MKKCRGRDRHDCSFVKTLCDSSLPWDILVGEIVPRLFLSSQDCTIFDGYTAAEVLDRVVVVLLATWLGGHRSSSSSGQSKGHAGDLTCAVEDVCRELAYQWYGSCSDSGYRGYRELILNDNALAYQRLRWNGSVGVLMASMNRYGSDVSRMGLCCVDEIDVGLGRSGLGITVSVESLWRHDVGVASVAVVRMSRGGMKTYGDVIRDLYAKKLYPVFLQQKGRLISHEEKKKIRVCDVEARKVLEYPGFSMNDVMALFVSTDIVVLDNGKDGQQRARIEFSGESLLDTMEHYFTESMHDTHILFTYGSDHPLMYHQEGSKVYHPCALEPLEVLLRAKRNRVRGCTLQQMNEWTRLKDVY